jgi:hypothetical protein
MEEFLNEVGAYSFFSLQNFLQSKRALIFFKFTITFIIIYILHILKLLIKFVKTPRLKRQRKHIVNQSS